MDRAEYINEAMRQLNDTNFYQKLTKPIYLETAVEYGRILQGLKDRHAITGRQMTYLTGDRPPKLRRFYLLPKIHKDREKWTTPFMPPGRPIVSDCGSESYKIAEYIDYYLNPISTKHPSYLKDTYDFINKVKQIELQPRTYLFTIDIDSLYTNIETKRGLSTVKKWLQRHPQADRPDVTLIQLLELSLTKNDFEFNGQYFLQTRGTAMGKKFAPAYANIYMAEWEETVLAKCRLRPSHYYRFLDDIWGTWPHTETEFEEFIVTLNSHHPYIKVKHILHLASVDFLDTTTFKDPGNDKTTTLDIRVFFKETDTHALLHKESFHPQHTFPAIVKAQLTRFHRICTRPQDFNRTSRVLFRVLRPRGYTRSFLQKINRQWHNSIGTQRTTKRLTRERGRVIPLIVPYSLQGRRFTHKIKENFSEMFKGDTPPWKIISAYRRNKNLKDFLVSSRMREKKNKTVGVQVEPRNKRLVTCSASREGYLIPEVPLNQSNCVYLISCHKCKKQYVGQTKNTIRARLHTHSYNIRTHKKRDTHLVSHFLRHGLENLRIRGQDHDPKWTLGQRLRKEREWIKKLGTEFPLGLNERNDYQNHSLNGPVTNQ
ncbi:hypothetical protein ACEWY4_001274 [Coilia grayii]|uniref:GIY-YIG domain-containing protein n=1 Tax=Coilia grayii TaxID=363190 RepID=A0ABD1KT22_9TELE